MSDTSLKKDTRFEFRTTSEDRDLFARAAAASGVGVSTFATEQLRVAALRVLADRTEFSLSPVEAALWDELNESSPRDLPQLREFLGRPSVFVRE